MERTIARLQRRRRIWEAKQTPKPPKPSAAEIQSRLLSLPRELRDQIYEYSLVAGLLQVRPADIDNSKTPVCRRTTFTRYWGFSLSREKITYPLPKEPSVEEDTCYQIACDEGSQLPTISLLQTCRQVYEEGAEIFYSKNTFGFGNDEYLIPTALAFFNDRPSHAMKSIKRIQLTIGKGNDRDWSHWTFHQHATWPEVNRFKTILQEQLPALDDISIVYRGWPPDIRADKSSGQWLYARRLLALGYGPPSKQLVTGVGILLLLHDFKRVSIVITADDDCEYAGDPYRLVAFTALLRSRLLKGGENLGHSNITLRNRHSTCMSLETGGIIFYNREKYRNWVVSCDDDERGKSYLQPPARIYPRRIDLKDEVETSQQWEFDYADGVIPDSFDHEEPDYCDSDDGETDSLKDFPLDDDSVVPIKIEHFVRGPWSKKHPKDDHTSVRRRDLDQVKAGITLRKLWECRCTRHDKCDGGEYCFHKACTVGDDERRD